VQKVGQDHHQTGSQTSGSAASVTGDFSSLHWLNFSVVSDQVSRAPFQDFEFLVGGDFDGVGKNGPLDDWVTGWGGQTSHVSVVFAQIGWDGHLDVDGVAGGNEVVDSGDPCVDSGVVDLFRSIFFNEESENGEFVTVDGCCGIGETNVFSIVANGVAFTELSGTVDGMFRIDEVTVKLWAFELGATNFGVVTEGQGVGAACCWIVDRDGVGCLFEGILNET